jgi:hypothetical protein
MMYVACFFSGVFIGVLVMGLLVAARLASLSSGAGFKQQCNQ